MDLLSLDEVAERLSVSRRRVQALVHAGQLPAQRIGGRWVVESDAVQQRRRSSAPRGRPVKPATAWRLLAERQLPASPVEQDRFRRLVHPRAEHRDALIHPSLLDGLRRDSRYVAGGRDAADAAGLPVGVIADSLDLYLRTSDLASLVDEHVVRFDASRPTVYLHAVPDDAWPFDPDQRFAPLLVAWLDLADRGDRAERLVRESLIRAWP